MRKAIQSVVVLLLLVGSAVAAEADELNELKRQLAEQQKLLLQMQQRIEQLESQQQQQQVSMDQKISAAVEKKQVAALPDSIKWVENVKISGDLRYRHESIDAESSSGRWKKGRTRHRLRARLMVKAMINGDWDAIFRLASGTSDPVSTNQTLDEGFSSKEFRLDLAYFDWHPESIPGLRVFGGKMKFPLYKVGGNQLIWDGDLNPEGLAANYAMPIGERDVLHLNGGAFWAEESSSDADQSLWAAQAYLKHAFDEDTYLLGGASYYCYGNLQNQRTIYSQDPDDEAFGNTFRTIGGETYYVSDYDLLEFFGEYGTKIDGTPVALFGSYVKNTVAATSADTGWLIGGKYNKAKKPGSWEVSYNYRELGADAVLGVFSDSDFIGGGTDGKGHQFGFKYQLAKNLQTGLTYFLNESAGGDDYRRLQADLQLKF